MALHLPIESLKPALGLEPVLKEGKKEGNVLFNDALKTFYLR